MQVLQAFSQLVEVLGEATVQPQASPRSTVRTGMPLIPFRSRLVPHRCYLLLPARNFTIRLRLDSLLASVSRLSERDRRVQCRQCLQRACTVARVCSLIWLEWGRRGDIFKQATQSC
jgi:hypothetical protein